MNEEALINRATRLVAKHEGLRLKPYHCPAGKLTIGYGRNIEDNGISKIEANFMLNMDLKRTLEQLKSQAFFKELDEVRQVVLMDMCFNLGYPRLMTFKKMISALKSRQFEHAADEMLDSRWAIQVGSRADYLANMMRIGTA